MTGGELGGRKLVSPPDGVRPTSDRVRESLFMRLGDLEGDRVLDLYAGTGSLGIEALSRGASEAVFVDRSNLSLRALRANIASLALAQRCEIVRANAPAAVRRLAEAGREFDLILLDPPYDSTEVGRALAAIAEGEVLAAGGQVVVESPKRHPVQPTDGLVVLDERRYGDTLLTRLEAAERAGLVEEEPPDDDD